jgi:hypothetical protein
VPDRHPHTEPAQPIRQLGTARVRSAHPEPEIREQLCDAAHPDAADADEVNPARPA